MFRKWRQKRKEKRKAREKVWQEWQIVAFCLQDVEFMDYGLPFNLTACGNELSLYEWTEKNYTEEICNIFREITEELTQGYAVLQWLRWFGSKPMPAAKKYLAGEGTLCNEKYILKCSENGADAVLLEMQMSKENAWEFIEQECYCYKNALPTFAVVEDATEYIEEVPCDLYIMIDLMHAAMMVKTRKEADLKNVETCMRKVCAKYGKEIHDYIGHLTQEST